MKTEDLENLKVKDTAGKLAKNFIYNPLTSVLAAFLLIIGYLALEIMPREEDPQIAISGGSIIVPAPGLSSKEIEKLITEPLEQKLREVNGVEHIYSVSTDNVAIVNVMYYIGQNREISNVKLYDKVMQNMDLLPKSAMQPLIKPLDIDIDIPIVNIAFYQKNQNIDYNTFVQTVENLKKEINTIANISKTQLKGAKREQFIVEVDLAKLKSYNLSLGQIANGISAYVLKRINVDSCGHNHSQENYSNANIYSAYLHMLSDTLISVSVVIAGIFIYFFKIYLIDTILTILFSLFILFHSYKLLKKSFLSLMDINIMPINESEIQSIILENTNVINYTDLHIYSPSSKLNFISFILILDNKNISFEEIDKILEKIKLSMKKIGFNHIVIEVSTADKENKCSLISVIEKEH